MGATISSLFELLFGLDPSQETSEIREDVKEIYKYTGDKIAPIVQDTIRSGLTAGDNLRGDFLYTVRDVKHEGITFLDATLDNMALVVDRQATNLFNTIQMSTLVGLSGFTLFVILYGDKLFEHGIRFGKINFL